MANKYSFFLGQGGEGGGTGDLNIHYGNTAPSETDKLWIECDNPDKVLLDNSLGIENGMLTKITDIIGSSFIDYHPGCFVYNNELYYLVKQQDDYIRCRLYSTNLSNGTTTLCKSETNKIGHCLANGLENNRYYYLIDFKRHSDSDPYREIYIYKFDINNHTEVSRYYNYFGDNYDRYLNGAFCFNNKLYYCIDSSLDCWDSSNNAHTNIYTFTVTPEFIVPYSNYIYYVIYTSSQRKLCRLNIDSGINEQVAIMPYGNGWNVATILNNNILIFSSGSFKNVYKVDIMNNHNISVLGTINENVSCPMCSPVESGDYLYFPATIGSGNYQLGGVKYKINIPLSENNLAINFNANNGRWNAINSNNLKLNINPISVYLGNSNNKGIKQVAHIHNGTSWVNL